MPEDMYRLQLLHNINKLREDHDQASRELEDAQALALRLYQAYRELNTYHPDDPPHKAVYVVARCLTLIESSARPYGVVEAYNDARARLEDYDRRKAIENG